MEKGVHKYLCVFGKVTYTANNKLHKVYFAINGIDNAAMFTRSKIAIAKCKKK